MANASAAAKLPGPDASEYLETGHELLDS
jgi:hypothetical protein